MPAPYTPQPRPGGRSARVRAAVHAATLDVIRECGIDKVSVPEVARRSAVHDSSIYRRWGSRENLIADTLLAHSEQVIPTPDTGSLRGDLAAFTAALSAYLSTPLGRSLTRTMAYVVDNDATAASRRAFWHARYHAAAPMIHRALERGELDQDTDPALVLEMLIAPVHFRVLSTREPLTAEFVSHVVDFVMRALTASVSAHHGGMQAVVGKEQQAYG
ncbi:TetR/AcrR family transcriptional regulator [Mycobacterium paraense]|uniref:TetR/AcrR family transcriptional regulator n=1 Tax=Mycobacterium paraense TaxID=767916 RepID=UPI0019D3503A|nr:TetR/AcrR family transcriptional regulator [Mycobacterium paraense]